MHKPKLICLDLDGTLLNKNKEISEENLRVLRICCAIGIQIYLVSGRPYCFTKKLANDIHPNVKVIASNGAIYEYKNICLERTIPRDMLKTIVDLSRNYQVAAFYKGKENFYTHEPYDYRFLYQHMNDQLPETCKIHTYDQMEYEDMKKQMHRILKVLVYGEEGKLQELRAHLSNMDNINITDYQNISFDITAKNVNKGGALHHVAQQYGLNFADIVAIGDGNNDISMFEQAGFKIAMRNGEKKLIQMSDYIAPPCLDDGVAQAIKHLFLR